MVGVYCETIKNLMDEEFVDAILSANDCSMKVKREPDPKVAPVRATLSGKFLSYRPW